MPKASHPPTSPSLKKTVETGFGRIKLFKKKVSANGSGDSEGNGDTIEEMKGEWMCATCNAGERWGRCRVRGCARARGPKDHILDQFCIDERERLKRMQEAEARRRFRGSDVKDNGGNESDNNNIYDNETMVPFTTATIGGTAVRK